MESFQSTPPTRGATKTGVELYRSIILFQSTPPTRGATATEGATMETARISIHAPHKGGDMTG